jgi:carbamoyltransferase
MTAILGISAFYHDSAAALVIDGRIVAAAQEERFTRKKHDPEFPSNAIEFCLQQAGITLKDIDYVAFYDKPLLKFERLLETYLAVAPVGFRSFLAAMPVWLRGKLYLPGLMRKALGGEYKKRFVFTEHHESHAASAFYPSPFESAAVLTVDGVGEWATATIGRGRGKNLELLEELRFPHSLGLLYSAFTYFCGFRVNSGEYKLMGLAPYGQPRYTREIYDKLIDLKEDGSFRMDMSYFNYTAGLTMTSPKFDKLFGGPPRQPESPITEREMDLAASIQVVTEDIMQRMARHARELTGERNLCLAGGVALNCVSNGKILRAGIFDDMWIQPAAGDAGGALGAALFLWHQLLGNERVPNPEDSQQGTLLGPSFSDEEIQKALDELGAKYEVFSDEELAEHVAGLLADEQVVGWFQGRMEFGPRALGSRSILGDARSPRMQSVMNLKIKFRESFRPFAPMVLEEYVDEYFDVKPGQQSPYMLIVAPVSEDKRLPLDPTEQKLTGIDKLKMARSTLPAVTHVDYSARIQTVDPRRHAKTYQMLRQFHARTGCPVIINTSYNVRGEPIVCTPQEAYRCFMATNIDALVLGNCVLHKQQQQRLNEEDAEKYIAGFQLD